MKKILLQLDTDAQASTFDSVVAIDAGVDELLTRSDVDSGTAVGLIHGAMFTRGGDQLKNTAIFVGGSQVVDAERLMDVIGKTFFGPVRNSVMMDANGCNTTAAAAVVSAGKHLDLSSSNAIVLGGTGPVGLRAARMLASEGCRVLLSSRSEQRARAAAEDIASKLDGGRVEGVEVLRGDQVRALAEDAQIVIACGAAGVELMSAEDLSALPDLKVAVDLNAVPPAGLG
ncbi:MAG: methylene-tetrahydromethanopterin dehydrogenase N-terminal domain-containing protein, partial [Planctomycetota bacterium]